MTEPLVSILIPTYNGARYLKHTLRSAREQTHKNIEIIVGDDRSTDATPAILAEAAASDPRIRVVRHPENLGSWRHPRALLDLAQGTFVKFLFHDDLLAPGCVRGLLRGLVDNPEASFAFSRRSLTDQDGRAVPGHSFPSLAPRPGLLDGLSLGDACLSQVDNLVGELTTVLFRRTADLPELLDQRVDGHLLPVIGDLAIWLMLLRTGPAYYTPEVLSRFRLHPDQNTQRPRIHARAALDWALLVDWSRRHGYLQDPAQERQAWFTVLRLGAIRAQESSPSLSGPSLEACQLAALRLAELATDPPPGYDDPLVRRAHGPSGHPFAAQTLDVRTEQVDAAVAVPGGDLEEILAAFAALHREGRVSRLVLAVPPGDPHGVSRALGEDDLPAPVEVVETTTPTTAVARPWLAMAAPGASWPDERAAAVFTVHPMAGART